eukprot:PhF_6_TR28108/c0_g1_i3/m.41557
MQSQKTIARRKREREEASLERPATVVQPPSTTTIFRNSVCLVIQPDCTTCVARKQITTTKPTSDPPLPISSTVCFHRMQPVSAQEDQIWEVTLPLMEIPIHGNSNNNNPAQQEYIVLDNVEGEWHEGLTTPRTGPLEHDFPTTPTTPPPTTSQNYFCPKDPFLFSHFFAQGSVHRLYHLSRSLMQATDYDAFIGAILLRSCGYITYEAAAMSLKYLISNTCTQHNDSVSSQELKALYVDVMNCEDVTWEMLATVAMRHIRQGSSGVASTIEPRTPHPLRAERLLHVISYLDKCLADLKHVGDIEVVLPLLSWMYEKDAERIIRVCRGNGSGVNVQNTFDVISRRILVKRQNLAQLLERGVI